MQKNFAAVDSTLANLFDVKVPTAVSSTFDMRPPVPEQAPDFVKNVLGPIIDGVVRGDIDVAIVWGPLGGWLAQRSPVPLTIGTIAASATDGDLPLSFAIGMGVRRDDRALRAELDRVVRTHRRALDALLRQFGVPLVPTPDARQP